MTPQLFTCTYSPVWLGVGGQVTSLHLRQFIIEITWERTLVAEYKRGQFPLRARHGQPEAGAATKYIKLGDQYDE